MRVLAISHYATWGGPINRALCLAPLLRERGIETMVLMPTEKGDAAERLRAAGVETIQIPLHRLRRTLSPAEHVRYVTGFPGEIRSIRRLLREHKIDLVQIYGLGNLQGGIAGKLEGIPVVWQLVDVGNPLLLRRLTMPVVLRLANVLMTTGTAVARAHPGAASFNDRLFSFFPPVDLNRFKADPQVRAAARKELGFAPDELIVGTVGNISPQKDHFTFVQAAAVLKQKFPATRFVILGATLATQREFAERLSQQAQQLGLSLGRDLTIRNPGTRVCQLAQAFDIFWLTSLWEGLPTAVEEAMALRIPVVLTDVGSVREAVEDGVNGYVVPARDKDAIVRATIPLAQYPEIRARIGAKAYSYAVENFDARICANVHARAFELAVENCAAMKRNGHPTGAGSAIMQRSNSNYKKADVAKFWNDNPCGSVLGNGAVPGTSEFFDRTEAERYKREPFIAEFARFQQWRGKKVLEVGCGMGTDLSMFTRYGAETWGVDLTHASAAIAFKRILHHGAQPRIMVGDSEQLPFPSGLFDLVYSWGVIHHTQNTPAAAKELLRVARPGGKVIAMIYNRRSLVALQAYLVYGLFRGRPFAPLKDIIAAHLESPGTKAYTVEEARELFLGLEDMRVTSVVTPYDLRIGRDRFMAPWVGSLVPSRLGYFLVVEGTKTDSRG